MGISIWQLLIVLGIVILLFGTKKLRHIGTDLGGAIRGFKKSMGDDDDDRQEKAGSDSLESEEKPTAYNASTEKTDEKTHS